MQVIEVDYLLQCLLSNVIDDKLVIINWAATKQHFSGKNPFGLNFKMNLTFFNKSNRFEIFKKPFYMTSTFFFFFTLLIDNSATDLSTSYPILQMLLILLTYQI